MSDGIHIPAGVVRGAALLAAIALIGLIKTQLPEARRYLKMEAM